MAMSPQESACLNAPPLDSMPMMTLVFVLMRPAARLAPLDLILREYAYKSAQPIEITMETLPPTLVFPLAPPATMLIQAPGSACLPAQLFHHYTVFCHQKDAWHLAQEGYSQTTKQGSAQAPAPPVLLFNSQTLPLIFACKSAQLLPTCFHKMSLLLALPFALAHLTCLLTTPPESV